MTERKVRWIFLAILLIFFSIAVLRGGEGEMILISQSGSEQIVDSGWQDASVGPVHFLATRDGGQLYGWGSNASGQLGIRAGSSQPEKISDISGWSSVAAGGFHSLALRGGMLYGWGADTSGQLLGESFSEPTLLSEEKGWSSIAAGEESSFAILRGDLYAWGDGWSNGVVSRSGWEEVQAGPSGVMAVRNNRLYILRPGRKAYDTALEDCSSLAAFRQSIFAVCSNNLYFFGKWRGEKQEAPTRIALQEEWQSAAPLASRIILISQEDRVFTLSRPYGKPLLGRGDGERLFSGWNKALLLK